MTYATGRVYFDADSHVVETDDWIQPFADPSVRDRLRPLFGGAFGSDAANKVLAKRAADPAYPERSASALMTAKMWEAMGAWDPQERSRALDLLGFHAQLVVTTAGLFPVLYSEDLDVLYGGARALNRAMAAFCAEDPRLLGVALVPLADPARAATETQLAIEAGCKAVMVPTAAPPEKSPTHPDYDRMWATLCEAEIPFIVHVGGGGRMVPESFRNNGRPRPAESGGEGVGSKEFAGLHKFPEYFFSMLVLDGLFDRFPTLKGASLEQGCEWLVTLIRRLDVAFDAFARSEPDIKALKLRPSEYVRRHLRFAPFPLEDVGWVTEQVGPDLLLFGTDYPHAEGGRNPLGHFERSFDAAGTPEALRQKFYSENFAWLLGPHCPTPSPA